MGQNRIQSSKNTREQDTAVRHGGRKHINAMARNKKNISHLMNDRT